MGQKGQHPWGGENPLLFKLSSRTEFPVWALAGDSSHFCQQTQQVSQDFYN
jgi:hypothetical protein